MANWFKKQTPTPTAATPGDLGLDPQGRILHSEPQPRRQRQGFQRMYAGAIASRLTADWNPSNSSADSELVASLTVLRSRSRQLCRDVSYARRAKQLVVNNVIGQGIGMQAQVYTTRDQLADRVNAEIEDLWCKWSEAENCHTGGRFDFSALERAMMGQVFEAGEVFVRKHHTPFGDSEIPLALEVIEAERIADQLDTTGVQVQAGNQIRMGIEVDRYFRPVAYYIRAQHPSEMLFGTAKKQVESVPADQIIHLVFGDRWPQSRGEPWMAPTLRAFRDAAGYVEAEVTRARVQASVPWTIETPQESAAFGETQSDGAVEMVSEPGVAKRLNPGEKMNAPGTNSPNPAVEPFMRYLLRDIASGVGVSYESLSRDYSQSNYSSSRLSLLDDRDLWRVFQAWFIEQFRRPIHCEWLQYAALAGAFSTFTLAQYASDPEKFEAVRFRPRGWGWVDPVKEVQAFRDAVRSGFMTMQDVVSQGGEDIEEIFEQRAKEIELADEAGLVFDTDPAQVTNSGAAQSQPDTPSQTDPPMMTDQQDPEMEPAPRRVLRFQR